jgi:hypothetical protein
MSSPTFVIGNPSCLLPACREVAAIYQTRRQPRRWSSEIPLHPSVILVNNSFPSFVRRGEGEVEASSFLQGGSGDPSYSPHCHPEARRRICVQPQLSPSKRDGSPSSPQVVSENPSSFLHQIETGENGKDRSGSTGCPLIETGKRRESLERPRKPG